MRIVLIIAGIWAGLCIIFCGIYSAARVLIKRQQRALRERSR